MKKSTSHQRLNVMQSDKPGFWKKQWLVGFIWSLEELVANNKKTATRVKIWRSFESMALY
jgi:hypothetical protein